MVTERQSIDGSVDTHWAHQRFVKNLINASRGRDLKEAACEWTFERIDAEEGGHCQLCNRKIVNYVLLRNRTNNNRLVIGEDCYDKLIHFLEAGRVESTLPTRDSHSGELRDYWRGELRKLSDRTVVGWLREELASDRVPAEIRPLVYTITRLGFAPTKSDADQVIKYYKATRKFSIGVLIGFDALRFFRHKKFMPAEITIDNVDRVKAIIERDAEVGMRLERASEARLLASYWSKQRDIIIRRLSGCKEKMAAAVQSGVISGEDATESLSRLERSVNNLCPLVLDDTRTNMDTRCREAGELIWLEKDRAEKASTLWARSRWEVICELRDYRQNVEAAMNMGVETAPWAGRALDDATAKIEILCPQEFVGKEDEIKQRIGEAMAIAKEWKFVHRWLLVREEIVVSIRGEKNYVLVRRMGRWIHFPVVERYTSRGVVSKTAVYKARVLVSSMPLEARVLLHRELPESEKWIVKVNFMFDSSHKHGSSYVGYHNHKVVLPATTLYAPGTYLTFLENEGMSGRYYRGWVIK